MVFILSYMLKRISGILFLGLMVFAGSSCVTPTHASSAPSVIIVRVQAGGPSASQSGGSSVVSPPLQEVVTLYNQALHPVDISGWCLVNKSNVEFACFSDDQKKTGYIIPSHSYVNVVSADYIKANFPGVSSSEISSLLPSVYIYQVTSQSSGSIVGGSDNIQLRSRSGDMVSQRVWSSSLTGGSYWQRMLMYTNPDTYSTTDVGDEWSIVQGPQILPDGILEEYDLPADEGYLDYDDIAGDGKEEGPDNISDPGDIGEGRSGDSDNDNDNSSTAHSPLLITELLPNPKGVDTGNEFIEFYNSGSEAVDLGNYRVAINKELTKWVDLPKGMILPAGEYAAIFNKSPNIFSLVNTNGFVQLFSRGAPVGSPIEYLSPKDDQSWALVGELWSYIKPPSPGAPNSHSLSVESVALASSVSEKAPCKEGQYRSEETGRCRKIETESSPAPCKEGYERNEETGRCRKIALASEPTPCKEGQERNPETNRCRKIVEMTQAVHGVSEEDLSSGNQPRWYYWAGIALIVALILGYGVWEWRQELILAAQKVGSVFAKR